MELLVAASALDTDSVEGHRSRPSAVMRLDLLKVVGSRPERLASPEGDNPARSASRSSAVQIWPWVSMRGASAWREAERQGVYRGSADDIRDGFIHFSLASQVAETARKHFFGQTGLFLIAVDADMLGDALRWEPSRNDELFPHLYGELDLGAVTGVRDMHARSDGYHDIPELTP